MAQHDYVIANGTGAAVRSDLNNALAAIVSQNSGATAPSTTYAYMPWADTTTGLFKIRNAANNGWITLYQLDGEWSTIALENGSAAAPSIYFKDSGTDTGVYSPGADQVAISTGGTGRLFVDSSGRVGLGTSSPSSNLTVSGSTTLLRIIGSGSSTDFRIDNSVSDFIVQTGSGGSGGSNGLHFYNVNTSAYRLSLTNDGKLGIGVTAPAGLLDLGAADNATALAIGNWGAARFTGQRLDWGGINAGQFTTAAFFTSGTEKARLTSDGKFLVGTSSTASAGGVSAQHAFSHSTSSQWAAQVQHTTAAGNTPFGLAIKYTAATPNGTSSDFIFCEDATAIRVRIYSNGGLANYSANNVNLSDRNVKKDITPADDTWGCLKEWQIVNFRYKDQPDDADLNMGVIAQQVAESCPEVITVFQEAKEAKEAVLDEEGNELEPAQEAQPEKLGVKDQQMMWMAIKALQEAQLRIETLEAKVAALEAL